MRMPAAAAARFLQQQERQYLYFCTSKASKLAAGASVFVLLYQ
jgi:hypothetical protein